MSRLFSIITDLIQHKTVGLLDTNFTMEEDFDKDQLESFELVQSEANLEFADRFIWDELGPWE